MTLRQEAYALLQSQPDSNIKIIVDLLRALSGSNQRDTDTKTTTPRRFGLAKGEFSLPSDFLELSNALDDEIAKDFYGMQ